MSVYFSLRDPDIMSKIESIEPLPGFCIVIDIVGSTALKSGLPRKWLSRIHDAFALARTYLHQLQPLKTIGDALMYYIPDGEMSDKHIQPLQLHLSLCFMVQEKEEHVFGTTKAAIAYCEEAYDVTFIEGTKDIYGRDIDLTHRLQSLAREGEIIMNEPFVKKVRANHRAAPVPDDFPDVEKIKGPWPQRLKGFSDDVRVYKNPAGGTSLSRHLPAYLAPIQPSA